MAKIPGKKVSILGLGISGFHSARFLHAKGFDVFVSEQAENPQVLERAEGLRKENIEVETGGHTFKRLLESDWILISPGIPPTSPVYQILSEKKVPIRSEIEVASWYCPSKKIIGVTGSSGKTTVTTLLGRVFQKAFGRAFVCGNIGNPWIGEVNSVQPDDFVILELSSFQLMHCESFRPSVGILLNISPNHQDWHRDMQDYANAKLRLFQNQTPEDWAVIRKTDQECFFPYYSFKSRKIYLDKSLGNGAATPNPNEEAVRIVSRIFGCDDGLVEDVLKNFEGIEHRLEKIVGRGGVTFVNDSKCTTTASLAWALEKFPDGTVILLAGGHPKSADFQSVRDLIHCKVKHAFLIGEARPLLRHAWEGAALLSDVNSFEEAVEKASKMATPGDTVLLSPACASFDMFKNYVERGELFKKLVKNQYSFGFSTRR